jgi:hypothetical protein
VEGSVIAHGHPEALIICLGVVVEISLFSPSPHTFSMGSNKNSQKQLPIAQRRDRQPSACTPAAKLHAPCRLTCTVTCALAKQTTSCLSVQGSMVGNQVAACNLASYHQEANIFEPVTLHNLQGAQTLLSFTQGHTSHPEMQFQSPEEHVEMLITMDDSDQDEDSVNSKMFLEPGTLEWVDIPGDDQGDLIEDDTAIFVHVPHFQLVGPQDNVAQLVSGTSKSATASHRTQTGAVKQMGRGGGRPPKNHWEQGIRNPPG